MFILISVGIFFQIVRSLALTGSPQITIKQLEITPSTTDNYTVPTNLDDLIINNALVLNKEMKSITLACTSFSPIQWKFTGFTTPLQVFTRSYRESTQHERDIFIAELTILRISAQLTGNWTCHGVQNLESWTSVHIYGDVYGYRGSDPYFLEHGKDIEIQAQLGQEIVFPCAVWKSTAKAYLGKRINGQYREMQQTDSLRFDPTVGFRIKLGQEEFQKPWGSYMCWIVFNKTFDRVKIKLEEKFEFIAEPMEQILELFENDTLHLKCKSLTLETVTFLRNRSNELNSSDSRLYIQNENTELILNNLTLNDEGVIECVVNDEVLHTWHYEVISKQDKNRRGWKEFYSARTGKVTFACWAKTSAAPLIAFVKCTSAMECQIRSKCFEKENRCDEIDATACSGGCTLITIVNKPGILKCVGDGVPDARIEQYIGVTFQIYRNITAMMAANDVLQAKANSTAHVDTFSGTTEDFNCTGSTFVFAQGFYWFVQIKNGENIEIIHRLDNTSRFVQGVVELVDHSEIFLETGHIFMQSRIKLLSTAITGVICAAPHWNSSLSSNSTVPVKVHQTTQPKLKNGAVADEEDVYFDLGDTSKNVRCEFDGKPTPEVTWKKDGKPIPRNVEIQNKILVFDEVLHAHSGVYQCTGWNVGGSVTRKIHLHIIDPKQKVVVAVSIGGGIGILILLVISIVFWKRIQYQKLMLRNLTDAEVQEFLYGNPDAIDCSEETNKQGHLLAFNKDYEFPKENLEIQFNEKLGSGAYGTVVKGIAKGLFVGQDSTAVAVKTIKPNADITYFKALLIELKIMSHIGRHTNIVNLLGACTGDIAKREVYIIVEFCHNGNMEKYLRSNRDPFLTNTVRYSVQPRQTVMYENAIVPKTLMKEDLLQWSYQIATGMEYLTSKKMIHGDLAARNVLLTEKLFAKIGDFGLSRQLYEFSNYVKTQQAPLPWRWMAIESLRDLEFSYKSDVWAYGITLWEIFSLAEVPYPGTNWTEDFVKKLSKGNRLPKPDHADENIYNIMLQCWHYEPGKRSTFTQLANVFAELLQERNVPLEELAPLEQRIKLPQQILNSNYEIR